MTIEYSKPLRIAALLSALITVPATGQSRDGEPMLAASPTAPGPSGLVGTDPPAFRYAELHADRTGATHVESCQLTGFIFKSYAPPAAAQWLGIPPGDIASIAYAVLPIGYVGAWHAAPGPQWVVVLSGRWSVETTDGTVLEQGPGDVQFNAESGAEPQGRAGHVGHLTRQVGAEPTAQLIVSLKKDARPVHAPACTPARS